MRITLAAAFALIVLTGCSAGKDVPLAQAATEHFHQQLNTNQFPAIYAEAAPALRAATKVEDFTALLGAVHRKLGAYQSGSSTGWNDNLATGGHFVTLGCTSKYERGGATETFVYRLEGDHASLVGFNINSSAMILN